MNVLLVAPRTDLLYADAEVQRILRSGLEVTPVLGNVTQTTLMDEIARQDYDALWLCTHGTVEGIMLSDGILPASALVQAVRNSSIILVVLNTCDSINTAQHIQNETRAEIIATIIEVPDQQAFQTGAQLATALARTNSSTDAYNAARPGGNRTYVRLAGGNVSSNHIDRQGRDNKTSVEERLARLEQISNSTQDTLQRIVTLMDGDSSWRIIGLPDQLAAYIKTNEDWKRASEQRIAALESGNQIVISPQTALLFAIGAIGLLIAIYIAVVWLQGRGIG